MSPALAFLVTGTDTGVGKTHACLAFLARARLEGLSTAALKPVASGCMPEPEGLRNEDALRLAAESTVPLPYPLVNPYAFEPAIAPHIAAARAGVVVGFQVVRDALARARTAADVVVVEGVGGWLVPLSERNTVADLAVDLRLPVVLVVGLRLGCLNHALLTAESVRAHGARLAGWVASVLQPGMPALEENLQALAQRMEAPMLGCLPYGPGLPPADAALSLRLPDRQAG